MWTVPRLHHHKGAEVSSAPGAVWPILPWAACPWPPRRRGSGTISPFPKSLHVSAAPTKPTSGSSPGSHFVEASSCLFCGFLQLEDSLNSVLIHPLAC